MKWLGLARSRGTGPALAPSVAVERVWGELEKASFVVVNCVTPSGKPRASGVVHAAAGRHLYMVTTLDSRTARQISNGDELAVPIRRPGELSLVTRITSIQRAVSLAESPWQEALDRG